MLDNHKGDIWPIVTKSVNDLVDFVKPTFGPKGKFIIIQNGNSYEALDDGISAAEKFESADEFENAIIHFVRESAKTTNKKAGDGTTGTLIMLQSIINGLSGSQVDELNIAVESFKKQITEKSKTISSQEELERIAYASFNNERIAKIISEVVFSTGKYGSVIVEESDLPETSGEFVEGVQYDAGFMSTFMISDQERMEAVLDDPYILITDIAINDFQQILPLMERVIESGKKNVLIIAPEVSSSALRSIVINTINSVFKILVTKAPSFGQRKIEILKDIAAVTNSVFVSSELGMKLEKLELSHLGNAAKVIAKADRTIISGSITDKSRVEERVKSIKSLIDNCKDEFDKNSLEQRLGKFSSGVGIIKVGSVTQSNTKSLRYKIEDSINAAKSTLRSGYVMGAGLDIAEISTGSSVLDSAIKSPSQHILGSGITRDQIMAGTIIDSLEMVISQVESAVSIANTLSSSSGILINKDNA